MHGTHKRFFELLIELEKMEVIISYQQNMAFMAQKELFHQKQTKFEVISQTCWYKLNHYKRLAR